MMIKKFQNHYKLSHRFVSYICSRPSLNVQTMSFVALTSLLNDIMSPITPTASYSIALTREAS